MVIRFTHDCELEVADSRLGNRAISKFICFDRGETKHIRGFNKEHPDLFEFDDGGIACIPEEFYEVIS
jgi:hypothetical protein